MDFDLSGTRAPCGFAVDPNRLRLYAHIVSFAEASARNPRQLVVLTEMKRQLAATDGRQLTTVSNGTCSNGSRWRPGP